MITKRTPSKAGIDSFIALSDRHRNEAERLRRLAADHDVKAAAASEAADDLGIIYLMDSQRWSWADLGRHLNVHPDTAKRKIMAARKRRQRRKTGTL